MYRTHLAQFPGGKVTASSAPEYKGDARFVNPEEMSAAAVASCHMLTLLAVAAKSRLHLLTYSDRAVAHLEKDTNGIIRVTRVDLHLKVTFKEDVPAEKADKHARKRIVIAL
jgi:organic hydroperoxide reductase OsmC/OhrA